MKELFDTCVDIIKELAAFCGISYEAMNIVIFVIVLPLIILILSLLLIFRKPYPLKNQEQTETNLRPLIRRKKYRKVIYTVGFILVLFVVYVNKDILTEIVRKENQNLPTQRANKTATVKKEQHQKTRFVFVIAEANYPQLKILTTIGYRDPYGYYTPTTHLYMTEWEGELYTSDIVKIDHYDQDSKYRFIDEIERKVRNSLQVRNSQYYSDVLLKCNDSDERQKLSKEKARIIDSEIYVFESYAEASIMKRKMTHPK